MRKTIKKALIGACSALMSVTLFLGISSCAETADFSAEFQSDLKTSVLVESCVDLEDYIVKVDGASYKIEILYRDKTGKEVTEVVNGATYYPMIEGEYTLRYTVTIGKTSKTNTMNFTVEAREPEIIVPDYPFVYSLNETVNFDVLLFLANVYVEPVKSEVKIEKVTYYKQNVDLEKTLAAEKEEIDLSQTSEFTFTKYGSYEFTFSATSSDKVSYGQIRCEVLEENQGNGNILYENGKYALNNAEINGNVIRLIQAEYTNVSYAVLDGIYKDQEILHVEFKGQNCPNIGFLFNNEETARNPYNIYNGQGYVFSLENSYTDKFSIWGNGTSYGKGVGRFGGQNLHNGNKTTGYFGRKDLDNDTYYAVELNIDCGSVADNLNVFHLYIYEIENYGTQEQAYVQIYKATVPAGRGNKLSEGKVVFFGSAQSDVTFEYTKPVGNVDEETFSFDENFTTLTWEKPANGVQYISLTGDDADFFLYEDNTYQFTEYEYGETPLYIRTVNPDLQSMNRGTEEKPKYTGATVVYNPILKDPAEPTTAYESEEYSASTSVTIVKNAEGSYDYIETELPFINAFKVNYLQTTADYVSGTYVMMEFQGSQFPGDIIFGASDISQTSHNDYEVTPTDVLSQTTGIGFSLDQYTVDALAYYKANKDGALDTSSTRVQGGLLQRGYFNKAENKLKTFLIIVGATQTEEGVKLEYYIYQRKIGNLVMFVEHQSMTVAEATLASGKIVITTSANVATNAVFRLYKPDTLENLQAVMNAKYGTYVKTNGGLTASGNGTTITKNGAYVSNVDIKSVATYKGYVATTATYGSGTYVMLEFKGANFPGQILFGATDLNTDNVSTNGIGWDLDKDPYRAYAYYKESGSDVVHTKVGNKTKLTRGYVYKSTGIFDLDGDGTADDTSVNQEKTYVVIAGATQTQEGIVLEYYLYEKAADGVCTLLETQSYTQAGATLSEGQILINNSRSVRTNAKFTLYQPDTLENLQAKLTFEE